MNKLLKFLRCVGSTIKDVLLCIREIMMQMYDSTKRSMKCMYTNHGKKKENSENPVKKEDVLPLENFSEEKGKEVVDEDDSLEEKKGEEMEVIEDYSDKKYEEDMEEDKKEYVFAEEEF